MSITNFAFWNNVPDPLLEGKEPPPFTFGVGEIQGQGDGRQLRQGSDRRPIAISKGIAGVSMRLEPGVTRELHYMRLRPNGPSCWKAAYGPRRRSAWSF